MSNLLSVVFVPEFIGTVFLVMIGCGVVANITLTKSKGFGAGTLAIWLGWGLAVFVGVGLSGKSGAYLNPAVAVAKMCSGAKEFVSGVSITFFSTLIYFVAELLGAFVGAAICYLVYKKHYDDTEDKDAVLCTFVTAPVYKRAVIFNFLAELVGTFVLCYWVLIQSESAGQQIGPLGVALVVVIVGIGLGGPTGNAINPARDLGPRLFHFIAPIKGKRDSMWDYSWIPIAGPIVGGILAGLIAHWVGIPSPTPSLPF